MIALHRAFRLPSGDEHALALDLAAAEPAFPLDAPEARALREHLRACPSCAQRVARMRADADALDRIDPAISPQLHDRLREAAVSNPSSRRPGLLGIVAIFVLAGLAAVGASVGAGGLLNQRPATPTTAPIDRPGDRIRWSTDVVELAASDLLIRANGLAFHGVPTMNVDGDPGDLSDWTLEATWKESGREQRLNLYFKADKASWWIDEVRVYNGAGGGKDDWATFPPGPFARTPLGAAFEGDLQLAGTSATGPVSLTMQDLRIAVRPRDPANHPLGGGKVLAPNADPFQPGGPLHCSGILQQPPRVAELKLLALGYQLSWRWDSSTGGNTGYAEVRTSAPDTGWITDTSVGSNGELIVFVADPARPFGGPPRPLPADCGPVPSG